MSELNMSEIANSAQAIADELKAIRHVLSSLWHSKYFNGETDQVSPDFYADEYISTTECAKRLNVTEQTVRNWILAGKRKDPESRKNAWIQGVHYILIPTGPKRDMIRIGWNNLIMQFTKGAPATLRTFDSGTSNLYNLDTRSKFDHVPKPKE
jgi:predicted DNA-binding protein YlxM (UPF0122 family)|tara:strand:- start:756 stop:1214 length:459 start_codon:yes stop_codon:yes gene_type:complete